MNRYILIRRLTWPAILLLLGIVALLHQADLGELESVCSLVADSDWCAEVGTEGGAGGGRG